MGSNLRHGIARRASCKQHLNKANNYKHVLPSQLAGLAGVPLKCTTRVCSPLHTGQLRIAKTLRILLDHPHHTLLLPARLQLRLVRTTMAAYGASIRNAFTCPKWQCNITRDGLGNCRLSSVCLEWNRRIACKRSHRWCKEEVGWWGQCYGYCCDYCVRWWRSGEAYEYPVWMLLYDCKIVMYLRRWRGTVYRRSDSIKGAWLSMGVRCFDQGTNSGLTHPDLMYAPAQHIEAIDLRTLRR